MASCMIYFKAPDRTNINPSQKMIAVFFFVIRRANVAIDIFTFMAHKQTGVPEIRFYKKLSSNKDAIKMSISLKGIALSQTVIILH